MTIKKTVATKSLILALALFACAPINARSQTRLGASLIGKGEIGASAPNVPAPAQPVPNPAFNQLCLLASDPVAAPPPVPAASIRPSPQIKIFMDDHFYPQLTQSSLEEFVQEVQGNGILVLEGTKLAEDVFNAVSRGEMSPDEGWQALLKLGIKVFAKDFIQMELRTVYGKQIKIFFEPAYDATLMKVWLQSDGTLSQALEAKASFPDARQAVQTLIENAAKFHRNRDEKLLEALLQLMRENPNTPLRMIRGIGHQWLVGSLRQRMASENLGALERSTYQEKLGHHADYFNPEDTVQKSLYSGQFPQDYPTPAEARLAYSRALISHILSNLEPSDPVAFAISQNRVLNSLDQNDLEAAYEAYRSGGLDGLVHWLSPRLNADERSLYGQ